MSRQSFFSVGVYEDKRLAMQTFASTGHDDTAILSISGNTHGLFALIASAIEHGYWDPSAVLSMGFKHDFEHERAHLVFLATDRTRDLNDLKAAVPTSLFDTLLYEDHYYAHLLGAMADDVNLGAFDKGFEQMFESDQVFHELFQTLYVSDGTVHNRRSLRGSSTKAVSLILLGGTSKRVVVAANDCRPATFALIPTSTSGPARYATIDESAFAVAAYGESRLYGLHVVQISSYLDSEIQRLEWRDTGITQGKIVELAVVDGVPGKLLLTLEQSASRYLPVDVRFSHGLLELTIDTKHATPASDRDQPPIVRINAAGTDGRGYIAHVDRESEYAITYSTIEDAAAANPAFIRTVSSVTNDAWGVTVVV